MSTKLPNINIEKSYQNDIKGYICGIDEVGAVSCCVVALVSAFALSFSLFHSWNNKNDTSNKPINKNVRCDSITALISRVGV